MILDCYCFLTKNNNICVIYVVSHALNDMTSAELSCLHCHFLFYHHYQLNERGGTLLKHPRTAPQMIKHLLNELVYTVSFPHHHYHLSERALNKKWSFPFTEEILNGKLHFSVQWGWHTGSPKVFFQTTHYR